MDASARSGIEEGSTGPHRRRIRTLHEKQAILSEVAEPGASIAAVARKHGLNANLLFGWRRLQEHGLLQSRRHRRSVPLLPVKVESPTLLPSVKMIATPALPRERGHIEIEFTGGTRMRLYGVVDLQLLRRVIKMLRR